MPKNIDDFRELVISNIDGLQGALDDKANKAGDNTQVFKIANGINADEAVAKAQLDTIQPVLQSSYNQIADTNATGTYTFDYSLGDAQKVTATGDFTLAFSNLVTGKVCFFNIEAVNWGDYTITLPTGIRFADSTLPTFTSGGTDELIIKKDDDEVFTMFVHNNVGVSS